MADLTTLAVVCGLYFAIVLAIGAAAYRRTGSGSEEYFLGGRTARTLVLFMALFGTNVTPFVLMGIPGLSYHHGVGVFGLNAAIVALGIPLTFWLIGDPAWRAARRVGAITPAELFAERFASPAVGYVLFGAFVPGTFVRWLHRDHAPTAHLNAANLIPIVVGLICCIAVGWFDGHVDGIDDLKRAVTLFCALLGAYGLFVLCIRQCAEFGG